MSPALTILYMYCSLFQHEARVLSNAVNVRNMSMNIVKFIPKVWINDSLLYSIATLPNLLYSMIRPSYLGMFTALFYS